MSLAMRPRWKREHTFRSNVLNLAVLPNGRLMALTERGVYLRDKNGKRWRKVAV